MYVKFHMILSPVLLHFAFPLLLIGWMRNFILIFSLSKPGFYVLLLLICFPHPFRIIFFTVSISYSLLSFVQYSYSPSNFIKLHLAVIAIDSAVISLKFCSSWSNAFLILLQTSQYALPLSYPILPLPFWVLLMF